MKLPEERKKFIELIEKGASVTKACKLLNIHRSTFYDWRNNDIDFLRSFMKTKVAFMDQVNDAAESWYHKGVIEGDRRYVNKWLDSKHPEYMNKPMNITIFKDGDIEKNSINLDKEELFELMRGLSHYGFKWFANSQDNKIKKEYSKWYKNVQPPDTYIEEDFDNDLFKRIKDEPR